METLVLERKLFEGPSFEVYGARWQKYRGDLIVKVYHCSGIVCADCLLKEALRQAPLRSGSMTLIDVVIRSPHPKYRDVDLSFVFRKNWAIITDKDLQRNDNSGQPPRGLELYGVTQPLVLIPRREFFTPPRQDVMIKSQRFNFADEANDFLREACAQALVAHERNCSPIDICVDKELPHYPSFRLHLVYEKMDTNVWQDVYQRKDNGQSYTEKELLLFLRDVVEGLTYAKERVSFIQRIAHTNIRASNIFIKNGRYKMGNYCTARIKMFPSDCFDKYMIAYSLRPEERPCCNPDVDPYVSDVYSLGVTVFELAGLIFPSELDEEDIPRIIQKPEYSAQFKELLSGIIQADVNLRLDLSQISERCATLLSTRHSS